MQSYGDIGGIKVEEGSFDGQFFTTNDRRWQFGCDVEMFESKQLRGIE